MHKQVHNTASININNMFCCVTFPIYLHTRVATITSKLLNIAEKCEDLLLFLVLHDSELVYFSFGLRVKQNKMFVDNMLGFNH